MPTKITNRGNKEIYTESDRAILLPLKAVVRKRKQKPDKYDKAIAYLTENPGAIYNSWENAYNSLATPASCLFKSTKPGDCGEFGCLTQVKIGDLPAITPAITKAIRADRRIPKSGSAITLEHLPVFAEWQRRLDKRIKQLKQRKLQRKVNSK